MGGQPSSDINNLLIEVSIAQKEDGDSEEPEEPTVPINFRSFTESVKENSEDEEKEGEVTHIVRWFRMLLKYLFEYSIPTFDMRKYSFTKLCVQLTASTAFIMWSQNSTVHIIQ